MSRKAIGCLMALALLAPMTVAAQSGDSWTIETMQDLNGILKAQWMDIRVEQVEVLSLGNARESSRLHVQPFRWVAGDSRRAADGSRLTYLVDLSDGPGGAPLPQAIEAAVDQAVQKWAGSPCIRQKVEVTKRPATGEDADIFDAQLGYGSVGNWQAADVVIGGWLPPAFFESVVGQGAGTSVLAMSVTFIFIGPDGAPTDIDNDGHFDTAANEIYFNDGFSWTAGGMDVQTVALHELGHSLGIGHVGAPLVSTMNPVYTGAGPKLTPLDSAIACSVWASWGESGPDTH
ncbi:MAG TPA: matrixin family metalloprotease [Thermoanaerobaculia bacterium]|nr:matrixin family metalloprotease [Thermoanaerobaculia bacterium]